MAILSDQDLNCRQRNLPPEDFSDRFRATNPLLRKAVQSIMHGSLVARSQAGLVFSAQAGS